MRTEDRTLAIEVATRIECVEAAEEEVEYTAIIEAAGQVAAVVAEVEVIETEGEATEATSRLMMWAQVLGNITRRGVSRTTMTMYPMAMGTMRRSHR